MSILKYFRKDPALIVIVGVPIVLWSMAMGYVLLVGL